MAEHPEPVAAAIDAAMRKQLANLKAAAARGVPRVGWKVGFHDAAAHQRMGIGGPLMGTLDGSRVVPDGGTYHPRPGSRPRAEVEVALHIGRRVAAGVSLEDARAAIAGIAPAFELVDLAKPMQPIGAMVEGGILHDAVAFGDDQPLAVFAEMLRWGLPKLLRGGEVLREGQAGRVPEDVATVVVSAANILGRYGEALEPGDRIICGSYIEPADIAPGDELTADLGPLGRIGIRVGESRA
jgi:2-oxo-hept-3-ene-1,7-dioate hydratase